MLTFCRAFSRRIFSMREPRPALAYIKKHPAGSEPAGLYKINQGGVCGDYPAAREMLPARNKYEKEILIAAAGGNSFFVLYLAFVTCYVSPSVVIPAAYVTGRWCRMVVITPPLTYEALSTSYI